MYLLGATLTKLLATLAAFMTVTAGLPSFQCRCPDGQVRFSPQASISLSGCLPADESSSVEAMSCCCEATKTNTPKTHASKKHSCCAHSDSMPQQRGGHDGSQIVVKATSCVKTLAPDAPAYSVTDSGTSVHQLSDTPVLWELIPILPSVASGMVARLSSPGCFTTPSDLVIIHCHITC